MPEAGLRFRPRPHRLACARGAHALGALATGALAFGALAIGALAVGRLAVGRARIKRLEIDELVVHRLRVLDRAQAPGLRPSPDEVGERADAAAAGMPPAV